MEALRFYEFYGGFGCVLCPFEVAVEGLAVASLEWFTNLVKDVVLLYI